jgi:oligoendopeptidase F
MSEKAAQKTGAENVAWDLSDLYAGADDPAIDRHLDEADARAAKLAEQYRGRVADLTPGELRTLVEEYERITELASRVGMYAYLLWSANTGDAARGALLQKARERESRLSQTLVFLKLEWANAPDKKAAKLMADPALEQYVHWLEVARRDRPYLLTEPEEKILAEKAVTGRSAWVRFFDQTVSAARYELDGEMVPMEIILSKAAYDPDREMRKKAAASFTTGLRDLAPVTTYVFNNILADKASDDRLRGYPTWITARNMGNEVDDSAVEALIDAVIARYDVVARYYHLKRDLLGYDELFDYDRYAPLPAADRRYAWEEGRDIVLSAYGEFHPRLASIAQTFFDQNWIDAPVRPGKMGGAYCYPLGGEVHPYVMLNYEANPRDVMTLAHELGHGVHGVLAQPQGVLQANTPLTTAETASVFGEMLVFQDLVARETDPEVRLALLTGKIEDAFATIFRQVSMNRFEDAIHTARRGEGELATERLTELWLTTQRDMFLNSVTMTDDYGIWWSYVSHFIHAPGYVYAYAFGNLLVLALYARYQEVGEEFATGYLDMLAAGGSDWPHEIVKPFGVDLTDPAFWNEGLQILDEMVTEAEELAGQV